MRKPDFPAGQGSARPSWPRSRPPDPGGILTTQPGRQRSLCDYTWQTITEELLNMEMR